MKSKLIILLVLILPGCSSTEFRQSLELINASIEEVPLSEQEVAAGLRDALSRGIAQAAIRASAVNGYFANPRLKIEFPADAIQVEKALRKLGLGGEVDRFVLQLNRGAEKAAARAKPIFISAITSMSIGDAYAILNGDQHAATRYLISTTGEDLHELFLPVISENLEQVNASKYYNGMVNYYNQLPLVRKVNPDLDEYATDRAIAGLFLLIADEEANIRANPGARGSQILRRVFGSLD